MESIFESENLDYGEKFDYVVDTLEEVENDKVHVAPLFSPAYGKKYETSKTTVFATRTERIWKVMRKIRNERRKNEDNEAPTGTLEGDHKERRRCQTYVTTTTNMVTKPFKCGL